MPTTTTDAPAALEALAISPKLVCVMPNGKPRSASLAPNSKTTWVGRCWRSSAAKRERPPEVVSPLMLALTTSAGRFSSTSCFSSKATQPLPRGKPYSADRLSPTTSSVRRLGVVTASAALAAAMQRPFMASNVVSAVKCFSTARRGLFF